MTQPTPITAADEDAVQRRAYREFVRTHHPDRGGDPDVFRTGLEHHRRRVAIRADDPRLNAPIVVLRRDRGPKRLVGAAVRAWERHRRPPRVQ